MTFAICQQPNHFKYSQNKQILPPLCIEIGKPRAYLGFPGSTVVKNPPEILQCRRHKRYRCDPWVGKISWSTK